MPSTGFIDGALNRFVKTNLAYETNPLIAIQDPTYLGFKLMFFFDQPMSGLLSTVSHPNTAIGYLERIGEYDRAYYLSQFVDTLRRINGQCPWYFQTITGLGEAWKRGFNEKEFSSKLVDRKISIGCLESVDLRMTALLDLYRKACFEWQYYREVVPWNLRVFTIYVYVYESRTINRTGTPDLETPDSTSRSQQMTERMLGKEIISDFSDPSQINNTTNRLLFRFDQCEFLPDESSEFLDKVSNSSMEMASQKLVFSYRRVYEENVYNLFSDRILADEMLGNLDKAALDDSDLIRGFELHSPDNPTPGTIDPKTFKDKLKDKIDKAKEKAKAKLDALGNAFDQGTVLKAVEDQVIARANNLLGSQIGKAVLGNVYGFSPGGLLNAASAGIGGLIQGAIRTADGAGSSITNDTERLRPETYFDEVTNNQPTVATGNVANGPSLTNQTEVASGQVNDGASLDNVLEPASGQVEDGPSIDNVESNASGVIDPGNSILNTEGTPPAGSNTGQSNSNQEGTPTGTIGGGPSLSNTDGIPTGTVGGGESLSNETGQPNGQVDPGQAASNSTKTPSGKVDPGQAASNVEGKPSGQAGVGGQSASNVESEPPASSYTGVRPSTEKPNGRVSGGESIKNTEQDPPKSTGQADPSLENSTRVASGAIDEGPSIRNRESLASGNVATGPSLLNLTKEKGGSIEDGPSISNEIKEPSGQAGVGGQSILNNTKDGDFVSIDSGASISNETRIAHGNVATGVSLANVDVFHSKPRLNDAEGFPGSGLTKGDRFEPSMDNVTDGILREKIDAGPAATNETTDIGLNRDSNADQPSQFNRTRGIVEKIEPGPSEANGDSAPPKGNVND